MLLWRYHMRAAHYYTILTEANILNAFVWGISHSTSSLLRPFSPPPVSLVVPWHLESVLNAKVNFERRNYSYFWESSIMFVLINVSHLEGRENVVWKCQLCNCASTFLCQGCPSFHLTHLEVQIYKIFQSMSVTERHSKYWICQLSWVLVKLRCKFAEVLH